MTTKDISIQSFIKTISPMSKASSQLNLSPLRWLEPVGRGEKNTSEEKVIRSMCRMCHGTCGTLVHVRNGRVVKIEGDPQSPTNRGTLCIKGLSTIQHQYNPRRLRYPIKRVGQRGEGKWQRITWDEAYEILAEKFYDTWKRFGKQATALCGGTGRHWQDWYAIFGNALGLALRFGLPPQCYTPRIEVITKMFGYRIPVADYYGFKGAKPRLVVHWGCNLSISNADGMHGSRPLEVVNQGAKSIVIDPVYNNLSEKADLWLPIRPATDVALAMGFLNVIINENLYDQEFVKRWTNLPGLVRDDNHHMLIEFDITGEERPIPKRDQFGIQSPERLVFWDKEKQRPVIADSPDINPEMEGEFHIKLANGSEVSCHTAWQNLVRRVNEYPPERVAEITWVAKEKIIEAARMIASNVPWALQWGVSFDHQGINSSRATQAAMMLVALTGDLDIPGGMAMWDPPRYRKASFPGEIGPRYVSPEITRTDLITAEVREVVNRYRLYPLARPHSDYINRDIAEGRLHVEILWVVGANPLLNSMNSKMVYEALNKIPFIVVWDHYLTSTAMIADLVLPVAMWTERDQIGNCHLMWGIMARQKCVEPLGEARSDEEGTLGFVKKMARRDPEYWNKIIPWNSIEEWLNWRLEPLGITWNELKERGIYIEPQRPYRYKETGFQLPSGKAEIWLRIAQETGQDPLPFFTEPPLFSHYNELSKEYPFFCITRRIAPFFHSEFRQVPLLRELSPEPVSEINPRTAKELSIEDGDWIYIESPIGRIKQRAKLTEAVHPKVVVVSHMWWFPEGSDREPELGGAFESNLNVLTHNDPAQGYDPLTGCPQLRGFLVKIYKAIDGPPKGLNVSEILSYNI